MAGSNLYTGTLDLLILRALQHGPCHGYAVSQWIRKCSRGVLQVEEGALYPALHRLEKRGWLDSEWGRTETNRQAKFYQLTRQGRRQLQTETDRWTEHADAVSAVLSAAQE